MRRNPRAATTTGTALFLLSLVLMVPESHEAIAGPAGCSVVANGVQSQPQQRGLPLRCFRRLGHRRMGGG
jgi:hypothetical protein